MAAPNATQTTIVPSTKGRNLTIRVTPPLSWFATPAVSITGTQRRVQALGGAGGALCSRAMNELRERGRALWDQLGRMREEVSTPALLLDLDAAGRNIERMARRASELGTALRPHVKAHKSAELARMQVAAGATGVACATVWEAVVMAKVAGVDDVLIANQVLGEEELRALAQLARGRRPPLRSTTWRSPPAFPGGVGCRLSARAPGRG